MIYELFPIPIYTHEPTTEEIFAIQHEISRALPDIQKEIEAPKGREETLKSNVRTQLNTITSHKLDNLAEYIKKHTKEYIKQTQSFMRQDTRIELSRSWINLYDKEDGQGWHGHADAYISGTYYYKVTNDTTSGQLSFRNPSPFMRNGQFPVGDRYTINVDYPPVEGALVLFPSWFEHRVRNNNTDIQRISISFDWSKNVPNSIEQIFI